MVKVDLVDMLDNMDMVDNVKIVDSKYIVNKQNTFVNLKLLADTSG